MGLYGEIGKMAIDNKSDYYDAGGIETLKIIKAKLTPEQYEGFLMGNAIKYLARANFKGAKFRDIEKASIYLKLLGIIPQELEESLREIKL